MENTKKDAYMVVGYACNQKCICCPLIEQQKFQKAIDINELYKKVNEMVEADVTDVTISGGEPTIYPYFFELISYIIDKGLGIHILSNGERFADINFATKFVELVKGKEVTVTTTFHSYDSKEHEKQNGSVGSFNRSLKGLKFLDDNNIQISLKHCITQYNYKDLKRIIQFFTDNFSKESEIQLWGTDVSGIDRETANKYFVQYKELQPYIEEALDCFEKINNDERNQMLTINNLPLCMCDCYYWKYFTTPNDEHMSYSLLENRESNNFNFGAVSRECRNCNFIDKCKGTYIANFEMFGDEIVKCPEKEKMIDNYKSRYMVYDINNINKLYFSIYNRYSLTPKGFTIMNMKNMVDVNINKKANELLEIIKAFDEGIEKQAVEELFTKLDINKEIINDWIVKGILE